MKQLFTFLAAVLVTASTFAQVGIGTTTPKTTLQVEGNPTSTVTADGIQIPALSLAQLDAKIAAYGTDQNGAIVYVNNVSTASTTTETAAITIAGFYYYQSSSDTWEKVGGSAASTTTYSVGDFAQGGIVFWVDATGQHGLVCAKVDYNNGGTVRWFAGTDGNTQAKGDGPYGGKANTLIIIAAQVAIGDDGGTYAARICNELQITEGGKTYGDWYLPSLNELSLMSQNSTIINATAVANGGVAFYSGFYWSSNEKDSNLAYRGYLTQSGTGMVCKCGTMRVRAVRSF